MQSGIGSAFAMSVNGCLLFLALLQGNGRTLVPGDVPLDYNEGYISIGEINSLTRQRYDIS